MVTLQLLTFKSGEMLEILVCLVSEINDVDAGVKKIRTCFSSVKRYTIVVA